VNLYGFCGNEPVSGVDALGNELFVAGSVAAGGMVVLSDLTEQVVKVVSAVDEGMRRTDYCCKLQDYVEKHGASPVHAPAKNPNDMDSLAVGRMVCRWYADCRKSEYVKRVSRLTVAFIDGPLPISTNGTPTAPTVSDMHAALATAAVKSGSVLTRMGVMGRSTAGVEVRVETFTVPSDWPEFCRNRADMLVLPDGFR
jgi:hypothetical protein